MRYKYITIEREYGSGGTQIAKGVANACQIPCYGREILEMAAKERNMETEEIERYEESVTNSFLYTLYVLGRAQSGESDMLAKEGHVFLTELSVISKLAADGPAIFVGHCASEALNDKKGLLRIFIKSNKKDKIDRVLEEYQIPKHQAESVMHRYDKKRANYYFANTTKKWTDESNYDLILDSGKLGISGCIGAIRGVYESESR